MRRKSFVGGSRLQDIVHQSPGDHFGDASTFVRIFPLKKTCFYGRLIERLLGKPPDYSRTDNASAVADDAK
jgi:hypothetical protein